MFVISVSGNVSVEELIEYLSEMTSGRDVPVEFLKKNQRNFILNHLCKVSRRNAAE